jgi:hypothetical protein
MTEDFDFNFDFDDNKPDPTGASELHQKLLERGNEFSILICDSVCNALENNIDEVIMEIEIDDEFAMDVTCAREDYLEALILNLPRVEEEEEYELCTRVVNHIKKLESEKND